jgi:hypothetical protein
MPNWKKVIVSGSDAFLRNITASGDISVTGNVIVSGAVDIGYSGSSDTNSKLNIWRNTSNGLATINFPSIGGTGVGNGNDPGWIRHYNVGDTGTMEFKVSDQDGINDKFKFGHGTPATLISVFEINAKGHTTLSGSLNVGIGTAQHITASGAISASGKLYGGLSNTTTTDFVVYNTTTGELTYDNPGLISSSYQIASDISGAIDAATGSLSASLSANTFKSTGQRSGNSGITGSLELSGTGHLTASGNISASGLLYASVTSNSDTGLKTVMYSTSTGRFFSTGSYGGGGGGTTPSLQQVTTVGNTTATGIYALASGVTGDWGGWTDAVAQSGFFKVQSKAKTFVTPQPYASRFIITGIPVDLGYSGQVVHLDPFPNNYIVYGKNGTLINTGDGGHGGDPTDGYVDGRAILQYKGGSFEIVPSGSDDFTAHRGIQITTNNISFFNNDASSSLSGSFFPSSASAQIKFDTGSSSIRFLAGSTTEELKEVLFISKSGDNPRIGVGTTNPLSTLDIRSISSSHPANIILRTNEDGVIEVGEETGRIEFAIESASFLGTNFISSGSTAAMFSRVVESSALGAIGNLVFTVNKSLATATTPTDAVTIGKGASANSPNEIGMAVSGNIDLVSSAPILTVRNSDSGNTVATLGFNPSIDFNDGQLILYNQGAQSVKLNGDQSPADASFIQFGNFALGGTTADERLTVEGNISASGTVTANEANIIGHITASGNISSSGEVKAASFRLGNGAFIIASNGDITTSNNLVAGNSPSADVHILTGRTTLNGHITASGNISASGTVTANEANIIGHITASGNISASGNILGDAIHSNGHNIGFFDSSKINLGYENDTPIQIGKLGNPIEFIGTVTASDVTLDRIIYNTASSALGSNGAIGDIVKFGNTTTVAGGLYYLKNDGTWDKADADAVGTATGSLAIAAATNSSGGMCLRGFVNPTTDPGAGTGNPVYLGTTLGTMQSAAPTGTGDIVRIVGYQYGPDLIYFNPSNDYIVHA